MPDFLLYIFLQNYLTRSKLKMWKMIHNRSKGVESDLKNIQSASSEKYRSLNLFSFLTDLVVRSIYRQLSILGYRLSLRERLRTVKNLFTFTSFLPWQWQFWLTLVWVSAWLLLYLEGSSRERGCSPADRSFLAGIAPSLCLKHLIVCLECGCFLR